MVFREFKSYKKQEFEKHYTYKISTNHESQITSEMKHSGCFL